MNNHNLTTLILCSFRYALGRSTYIVQEIADLIIQFKDELPFWVKARICKEISSAYLRKEFRSEYDEKTWLKLARDLNITETDYTQPCSIADNLQEQD